MPAITPTLIEVANPQVVVLNAADVAAGDFVQITSGGYNPGNYSMMRVSVKSGTPGADKVRFINRADGMTSTLILESAGVCVCPDNVSETGFLMHPTKNDTVAVLAGGGTCTLVVELIP